MPECRFPGIKSTVTDGLQVMYEIVTRRGTRRDWH